MAHFPHLHFFVALSSCVEFYIFMGIIIVCFYKSSKVQHQAMNKLGKSNHMKLIEQCVSKKTNEAMLDRSNNV